MIGDEWEVTDARGKQWVVRQVRPISALEENLHRRAGTLTTKDGTLFEGWVTAQGAQLLRVTMSDGRRAYGQVFPREGAYQPRVTWTFV